MFISRRRKDGGEFEQELIDYFKANQARTWEARGLVNLRKSRDKEKKDSCMCLCASSERLRQCSFAQVRTLTYGSRSKKPKESCLCPRLALCLRNLYT